MLTEYTRCQVVCARILSPFMDKRTEDDDVSDAIWQLGTFVVAMLLLWYFAH